MIGIGIVTYNRPDYFKTAVKSVFKYLDFVDHVVVVDDGSKDDYVSGDSRYEAIRQDNGGVAKAKNTAFKYLIDKGCDYIFIMEDDMEIIDRKAIIGYLAAFKMTGIDHLLYSQHGPGNKEATSLMDVGGPICYWRACVGSWCFYTRELLEKVGLMDENFMNAWEHVEHTWRIAKSHSMSYGIYPDVLGSADWIKEQDGAIENSSIGSPDEPERIKVIIAGLEYWKQKDKEFPAQHTLDYFIDLQKEMEE